MKDKVTERVVSSMGEKMSAITKDIDQAKELMDQHFAKK